MADIEKTACRNAWTYPIIDIGRSELRNCCRVPFNTVSSDNLREYGTDIFKKLEPIKQVKRDLLMGVKTEKCSTCWKSEEFGIQSPRRGLDDFVKFLKAVKWQNLTHDQIKKKLYSLTDDEIEELINLEHPEHIEVSLSTTCDLKCIYCNHVFSSQWATEKLKYNEIKIEQLPKNNDDEYEKIWWDWFENVASKTVDKITFVGGEPLINEKFYYYVDRLIDYYETVKKSHVHIFVATNFNSPKKYLDKLLSIVVKVAASKYINFGIGLSFESTGKRNEFIRTNSKWDLFTENVLKLITTTKNGRDPWQKIHLVTMPAINALSISDLPNFLKFIIAMRNISDKAIRLSNTHVTHPMRYSPFILTADYTSYIDEAIELLKNSKWFTELKPTDGGSWIEFVKYLETLKQSITNVNSEDEQVKYLRREFVEDLDKLCIRRNLDFHNTFPEMIEFYNFCKKQ